MLVGGGAAQLALGLPFLPATIVPAGFVLGFVSQAVKICVDTTLQESVADDFRGRVFSVYDTLFNVTFVARGVRPRSCCRPRGVSSAMLVVVGAGYLLAAAGYARITRRH